MELREVTKQDKNEILKIYKEYLISKQIPGIDRFEGIRDFEKLDKLSFEEWINYLEKNKYKENLPDEYSPQTLFLAIDDNQKIVGVIGLRWKQVPVLMTFGGLIGYSIRPSQRGNGYASEMLRLAMEKFKKTDIDKILITCKDFNIASKKVIEKNGGILKDIYENNEDGFNYLRYWIKI